MADDEGRRRSSSSRPISTIVIVIAMEDEALPIIRRFNLVKDTSIFPEGVPWIRYHGCYNDLQLNVVWQGKDPVLGVNNVGTVPAALATYASIQAVKPDLIINAGTACGFMLHFFYTFLILLFRGDPSSLCFDRFQAKGAQTGDVFLVSSVAFHHRRNPLPIRDLYCIGLRRAFSTPALSSSLQLKAGVLSTGDSFDMCERDQALAEANNATLVDMEGAAVAYIASLLGIPVIFLKVVSNSVDGGAPSPEEFQSNLASVTTILGETMGQVVDFIHGKRLCEL